MKLELSNEERAIFYNQYKILEKLYPEQKEDYQMYQEILMEGYKKNYDELGFSSFSEEEMKEEESQFVIDVINMYIDIQGSYKKLSLEDTNSNIKFKGFDGNNEIKYKCYAEFYLKYILDEGECDYEKDLNTHRRMKQRYEEMLCIYKQKFKSENNLTLVDIRDILE